MERGVSESGEIGDVVWYVCPARHNTHAALCEPGDVHAAIVAAVGSRDRETGAPQTLTLAALIPGQPLLWLPAVSRAERIADPARRPEVVRITRGKPPVAVAHDATTHDAVTGAFQTRFRLDVQLETWMPRGGDGIGDGDADK